MVSVSHYKEFYSLIGSLVGVIILSKELDDKSNLNYQNNIMDNELWMRFDDNINIQVERNTDYWICTNEIYLIMDEPNVFTLSLGNVNYKGDFKKIETVINKLFFYN